MMMIVQTGLGFRARVVVRVRRLANDGSHKNHKHGPKNNLNKGLRDRSQAGP